MRLLIAVVLVLGPITAGGCTSSRPNDPIATLDRYESAHQRQVPAAGAVYPGLEPMIPARLVFVGDIMLGRGVAPVAAADPDGLFSEARFAITKADLAYANLESPFTVRPHVGPTPYALEADPDLAVLLRTAGFDALSVANNHAGDAGLPSIVDTLIALEDAGVAAIGGGRDWEEAHRPALLDAGETSIATFAFDASQAGLAAGRGPGIARWDASTAEDQIKAALESADLVTVSIHGGVEYATDRDPDMWQIATQLAEWGVDVVWGHGPHMVQPIEVVDPDGDDRPTVIATSLGNFLFDQDRPGTETGAILEVMASTEGVQAYRVGATEHDDRRVHFIEWRLPEGDAVLYGLDWWTLTQPVDTTDSPKTRIEMPDVVIRDAGLGDITGDGTEDLVVAFRRVFRETEVTRLFPDHEWVDEGGRSAHLGVYRPGDFRQWWVAGSLFDPVEVIAVCDGSLAVGYSSLQDPAVVATGGWRWRGFGFATGPDLPGVGIPGCKDVDGDGLQDPVITNRETRERN
jgi:poly-gamma-glutamate capsule biosynthesis protein CapA/YwtB (metallophosphatase superfamily)